MPGPLYAMTHDDGCALLCRTLGRLLAGRSDARPRDGEPRYYRKSDLPSRQVDPASDPATIASYARALHLSPFEPAFFVIDGRKLHLVPAA